MGIMALQKINNPRQSASISGKKRFFLCKLCAFTAKISPSSPYPFLHQCKKGEMEMGEIGERYCRF
jgi:hypothetical protein